MLFSRIEISSTSSADVTRNLLLNVSESRKNRLEKVFKDSTWLERIRTMRAPYLANCLADKGFKFVLSGTYQAGIPVIEGEVLENADRVIVQAKVRPKIITMTFWVILLLLELPLVARAFLKEIGWVVALIPLMLIVLDLILYFKHRKLARDLMEELVSQSSSGTP